MGEEIKQIKLKIRLPQEELREKFPLLEITGAAQACSGCLLPLLAALGQLAAEGAPPQKRLTISLGKGVVEPRDGSGLFIGDCTKAVGAEANRVEGCPPSREAILSRLRLITGSGTNDP
jgi:hypothetical protein